MYCGANYYGPSCDVNCLETDDCTGHYTCDPDTGAKVCKAGWSGMDCTSRLPGYDDCPISTVASGEYILEANSALYVLGLLPSALRLGM